jgi:hypothetical protein
MARQKDTMLALRVSRPELAWFHRVAQAQGIPLSELVRQSVAIEGARLGVPAPAATAATA